MAGTMTTEARLTGSAGNGRTPGPVYPAIP